MRRGAYILSVKRMKTKELFYKGKIVLHLTVAVIGIVIALRYSRECYQGIENGIGFCLGVLVPSLFFFMIASAYLVQSGIASMICKPLGRLSKALFGLPPEGMAVILLAAVGGYPVGAVNAAIMQREGRLSPSQAAKTAYIAVASGPGFLLSYVGESLLNSRQAGWLLLAAQVTAMLLTGVIVGRTVKCKSLPHASAKPRDRGNLLVGAVHSASAAAFGMCAMVVLFSALIEVCDAVVDDRTLCNIASAILEITNGCNRLCGSAPLYVTAFFIGFGGLSVHFQVFSALGDVPLKKRLFFLFRIIEGIIMSAATYIYLMFTPMTTAVFNSTEAVPTAAKSATAAGSAALVISGMLFIASVSKRSKLSGGKLCAE